jgi:hypothetical protein
MSPTTPGSLPLNVPSWPAVTSNVGGGTASAAAADAMPEPSGSAAVAPSLRIEQ